MSTLVFFTICYAIVSVYKLTYVAHVYPRLSYSATGIGLHLFVIVIRNGTTAAGILLLEPAQWTVIHQATIGLTAAGVIYQVWRDRKK